MGYDKNKRPVKAPSFTPNPTGIAIADLAVGTDGQVIIARTSTTSRYRTLSGDVTVDLDGVMAIGALKVTEGMLKPSTTIGLGVPRVCHAKYDFAVDGGAVTTITLASNGTIPINAIIKQVIISVSTSFVGSTGNVSFGLSAGGAGAAALLANTARGTLSAGVIVQGIPVQSAAGVNSSFIKMSAAGAVTMTIATNALTAGVADIFVEYVVPTA